MNTIFYLLIVSVSITGGGATTSMEKIPQKSLQECQTNSSKIYQAKYPKQVGITTYCLSGVKN